MVSTATRCLGLLLSALILSGCAAQNRRDPLEPLNRGIYRFNDVFDKALAKPVAQAYDTVVPGPLQLMARSFFSNLDDVVVTFNDLLQFKFNQALQDGGRVLVNSTFGLGGIADVASAIGLEKHDEDFGQTLGRWGIDSGPYLVLPFFGPSSVRDGLGRVVDANLDLVLYIDHVPTRNQTFALRFEAKRADLLDAEKVVDEAAIDRYSFLRDAYLQRRRSLVHDGNPPRLDDEESSAGETMSRASETEPSPAIAVENTAPVAEAPAQRSGAAEAAPDDGQELHASKQDSLTVNTFEPAPVAAFPDGRGETPAEAKSFIVRVWLPKSRL